MITRWHRLLEDQHPAQLPVVCPPGIGNVGLQADHRQADRPKEKPEPASRRMPRFLEDVKLSSRACYEPLKGYYFDEGNPAIIKLRFMKRIITAAVLLPILLLAVWSSEPLYFLLLAAVATILGLREFYILAERAGCRCHPVIGYAAAIVVLVGFYRGEIELILAALLIHYGGEMLLWLMTEKRYDAALVSTSASLAGVIYVAVFLGFLILLRVDAMAIAPHLLTLAFAIIMAGDTGAYYVGRLIGRRRLAPHVSPAKTVEGSIGGLGGSLLAAGISKGTFFPDIPWGHLLVLAVVVNIVGQIGDLIESMLKRGSQVKDAAALLPGHGGMLDRLDSIIFNAPIIYLYFRFFYHT